jgi:hypothetical protein
MADYLKRLFGRPTDAAPSPLAPDQRRPPQRARRFGEDRAKMFDLYQTRVLHAQLAVPEAERDSNWCEAFFPAAWNASIMLGEPPIVTGPDGYPYLRLAVPTATSFEANCLAQLAGYAIDNGAGAAFYASPDASAPAYLMSLGQLYSLMRYDSWDGDPQDVDETRRGPLGDVRLEGAGGEEIAFEASHEIMLGAPSHDFLPAPLAAAMLRHVTLGWGMTDPRVGLLIDLQLAPSRNLLLNCREGDLADAGQIETLMGTLLWYLPPARALMMLPEGWSEENLVPLADYADRAGPT